MSAFLEKAKSDLKQTKKFFVYAFKKWRNGRARRNGEEPPYKLSRIDNLTSGTPPSWWQSIRRFNDLPPTVQAASIAFLFVVFLLITWGAPYDWEGVTVEFYGLAAEIFILGIVIFFIGEKYQAAQFLEKQRETIEDFKFWESEEAKFRILGAMRRLQQKGAGNVRLSGVKMSSVNLKEHGIVHLDGSVLSGGHWAANIGVRTTSEFREVDFSGCTLRDAKFSQSDGLGFADIGFAWQSQGKYIDCDFRHCDLSGSVFEQGELVWSETPPEETHVETDTDENGFPVSHQVHFGPFFQADMTGVSFKNTRFQNVDFRDAENLEAADFSGATGLETCVFDDGLKEQVISSAKAEGIDD